MLQALQSIWILVFGILFLYIAGLPLAALVTNNQKAEDRIAIDGTWALAPFLGYGIVTVILNLLVWMNIPVQYSAFPVLALFLGVFIWFLFRQNKKGKLHSILPSPVFVFTVVAIVMLISFSYVAIGAKFYKGYAWWDAFFNGSQAEFLKTTPLSKLHEAAETQPYVGTIIRFYDGAHRLSRGTLQAFVASITGVDGASTTGFLGIYSTVLVFHALFYATKDIPMRRWIRYAGCAFSAVIPNVVMSQLECFLGMALFVPFGIVFSKLFSEILFDASWKKSLAVSTFVAAAVLTMLQGAVILALLAVITLLVMYFKDKVPFLTGGGHLALVFLCAAVLILPFWRSILAEIGDDLVLQKQNSIYSFAYSPTVLDWAFWGSTLSGAQVSREMYIALTLLAIGMLILGIYALLHLFIAEGKKEGLLLGTLTVLPTVFLSMPEPFEYPFYKMFSCGIPIVAWGVWKFADLCLDKIEAMEHALAKDRIRKTYVRIMKRGLPIGLVCVFAFSCFNSVKKVKSVIDYQVDGWPNDPAYRTFSISETHSPGLLHTYSELEALKDEDVLLMDLGNSSLGYWWSTYYGRDNRIYSLLKESDNQYFFDQEYARTDYSQIPNDAVIVWMPGIYNAISDPALQGDYAAILRNASYGVPYSAVGSAITDSSFELYVFAREPVKAEVVLSVAGYDASLPLEMTVQGKTARLPEDSLEMKFQIEMAEGGQMIQIVCNQSVTITGWRIDILNNN